MSRKTGNITSRALNNVGGALRWGFGHLGPKAGGNSKVSLLPHVEQNGKKFHASAETAMQVHSVMACVNAISDTVAMLDLNITEQNDEGQRERLSPINDQRARIIGERWNDNMTKHDAIRFMLRQYLLNGVAYALVQRRMNGMLASITPIENGKVRAVDGGYALTQAVVDVIDENTDLRMVPFRNMIAIRYDSCPNHKEEARGPVQYGKSTIELAQFVQNHLINYFTNGSPNYLLAVDLGTDDEANKRKIQNIKDAQVEFTQEGFPFGIVPGETEITHIGNTPEQAQMAALWIASIQAVARLFDVPPAVIGENSRSTFSNADQQASSFRRFTLQPIIDKLEQEFNLKVFGQQQNSKLRVEFDTNGFEKTDTKSVRDLMVKEVQVGIRTRNEARLALGMQRSNQEGADDLMVQMQDVSIDDEEPGDEDEPDAEDNPSPLDDAVDGGSPDED